MPVRIGSYDRLVTIQRRQLTASPSGAPIISWVTIAARRPASYRPVRGEERFAAPQWVAREQVEFRVRYSANVAALSPLDRIVYPAIDPDTSPPDVPAESRFFDIMAVHEVERRRALVILAARRPDAT